MRRLNLWGGLWLGKAVGVGMVMGLEGLERARQGLGGGGWGWRGLRGVV